MNRLVAFVLLAFVLITNGCGTVQIEDRAFVTAIALDAAGAGAEANYLVTVEIFRPGVLQERGENSARILQTAEAENFDAALEQLQARLARVLTLSHLKVVLIGEEAARRIDIREVVDYFERHPEVQMRSRVMAVQDGQAMDILKVQPLFGEFMAEELIAMARKGEFLSLTYTNPFFQFVQDLRATGGRALMPRIITTSDKDGVILHGTAIFKDYRLAGWLSNDEVHAANWILGDLQRTTADGELDNNTYSYAVRRHNVRIIPQAEEQQLRFTVRIETEGILRQQQGKRLDMSDPQNIKKVEDAVARTIVSEAQDAVSKAQQDFRIDYLGFGRALKRHNPTLYEQMQWERAFPTVPIDIQAETRISLTGKRW